MYLFLHHKKYYFSHLANKCVSHTNLHFFSILFALIFFRDLRNNKLKTISKEVLEPLGNLKILYLNGNYFTEITRYTLPRLEKLLILSIADNQILNIEPNAMDLPKLEHL